MVVVGTVSGSEGERADGEVVVAAEAADGRAGEVGEGVTDEGGRLVAPFLALEM